MSLMETFTTTACARGYAVARNSRGSESSKKTLEPLETEKEADSDIGSSKENVA